MTMTSLARYHGRSPRYILNTEDDNLVRVAGPNQVPWEEGTEIRNVSLTGLAFTAPDDLCPVLGEVVKIQFTPPGSKQMACYGVVTRLDRVSTDTTMVALHFYKMEMPHRISLAQGLARKLKERQERGEVDSLIYTSQKTTINLATLPAFFLMTCSAILWCLIMGSLIKFNYDEIYKMLLGLF